VSSRSLWRGWNSTSAIFFVARSRHSIEVSMPVLDHLRLGAFKRKSGYESVQNRTGAVKEPLQRRAPAGAGLKSCEQRLQPRATAANRNVNRARSGLSNRGIRARGLGGGRRPVGRARDAMSSTIATTDSLRQIWLTSPAPCSSSRDSGNLTSREARPSGVQPLRLYEIE
jgi:hypothetical protein